MVEKYIKELLFEQDCVILPGFGAFLGNYVSADIHPLTHKFLPPSKKLAFNSQLKNNDGLLIESIALGEGISREEATEKVEQFVKGLNHILESRKFCELKDIGKFFYNQADKLEFEPDNTTNYYEDSFSLPELLFKPIERNSNTLIMNKPVKPARPTAKKPEGEETAPKKVNASIIILPIILLLIGGATAFFYFNQDNESLASINPFVIFGHKEEVKAPEPAPVTEVVDTMAVENEITAHTSRYFIVVGSFYSKENAMKMKNKLERKNVNATVVEPTGDATYFRVAVDDFESKEDAIQKLDHYKPIYGKSIWVLSY